MLDAGRTGFASRDDAPPVGVRSSRPPSDPPCTAVSHRRIWPRNRGSVIHLLRAASDSGGLADLGGMTLGIAILTAWLGFDAAVVGALSLMRRRAAGRAARPVAAAPLRLIAPTEAVGAVASQ